MMRWVVVSSNPSCVSDALDNVLTQSFADGFFDAGMLMQALKAKENAGERPSEKVVQRREVGKKLRLMEY
jgi:hypothetical protein